LGEQKYVSVEMDYADLQVVHFSSSGYRLSLHRCCASTAAKDGSVDRRPGVLHQQAANL
jgi:hypothetical protein